MQILLHAWPGRQLASDLILFYILYATLVCELITVCHVYQSLHVGSVHALSLVQSPTYLIAADGVSSGILTSVKVEMQSRRLYNLLRASLDAAYALQVAMEGRACTINNLVWTSSRSWY